MKIKQNLNNPSKKINKKAIITSIMKDQESLNMSICYNAVPKYPNC